MSCNAKNYNEQGGEKTVINGILEINGTLTIGSGATLTGLPTASYQAASEAATVAALKEDLNALITKLKTAGLMSSTAPADDTDTE